MRTSLAIVAAFWASCGAASSCPVLLHASAHSRGAIGRMVVNGYPEGEAQIAAGEYLGAVAEAYLGGMDSHLVPAVVSGVWTHIESPEDLRNAMRALRQGRQARELYFSRIAVFFSGLQESGSRRGAFQALTQMDRSLRERGVFWHPEVKEVVYRPLLDETVGELQRLGITVSSEPVHGLSFNRRVHFPISSLYSWELEAARLLSRVEKDEVFLGLGDKGVRQFHRFYALDSAGRFVWYMPTADFLSLQLSPTGPGFVIHEMKNSESTSPVDVEEALRQIASTATQLGHRFARFPIHAVEILVPERGPSMNRSYRLAEEPYDKDRSIYRLIHVVRGEVSVAGLPVLVRLLPPRK